MLDAMTRPFFTLDIRPAQSPNLSICCVMGAQTRALAADLTKSPQGRATNKAIERFPEGPQSIERYTNP
jgi:hypothetical protein